MAPLDGGFSDLALPVCQSPKGSGVSSLFSTAGWGIAYDTEMYHLPTLTALVRVDRTMHIRPL
eukprot:4603746-Ditylum_brightwellii.AAC.1